MSSEPQHVSAPLQALQEDLASQLFGIPLSRAKEIGVCINCKKLAGPRCYSAAGRREYSISGLCEICFDEITS